jgi:Protein of unknown function (DUF2442)
MKSGAAGNNILVEVEILNVSPFGIWILVQGREFLMKFEQFPWFKNATLQQIFDVEMPHSGHLYWPQLDIDLSTKSLSDPDLFPLLSKS